MFDTTFKLKCQILSFFTTPPFALPLFLFFFYTREIFFFIHNFHVGIGLSSFSCAVSCPNCLYFCQTACLSFCPAAWMSISSNCCSSTSKMKFPKIVTFLKRIRKRSSTTVLCHSLAVLKSNWVFFICVKVFMFNGLKVQFLRVCLSGMLEISVRNQLGAKKILTFFGGKNKR